jgi:hypothetical protein
LLPTPVYLPQVPTLLCFSYPYLFIKYNSYLLKPASFIYLINKSITKNIRDYRAETAN